MADSVFAHMTVPFHILQLQRPFQMMIDIMLQFPQIGGALFLSVLRIMRVERPGEKLCQNSGYKAGIPQLVGQRGTGFAGEKQL